MEKQKKHKRSSYKGRIGSGYSVDARFFKNDEQRKSVKKNLETTEGCLRLLKNSNPRYWMLVMGNVIDAQRDTRWLGYNRELKDADSLEKSLKHRIAHILRLDDKKYYYEKLFAVDVLYKCDLHHPRFLKDYIDFYVNLASSLKDSDPIYDGPHPLFNHVDYSDIGESSIYLLRIIISILRDWDSRYEYPGYLYGFIDRASEKMNSNHDFKNAMHYTNVMFNAEHLQREIVYHDPREDRIKGAASRFEMLITSLDTEGVSRDYQTFYKTIENTENPETGTDVVLAVGEFNTLKEKLFQAFIPLFEMCSNIVLTHRLKHGLYQDFYEKYGEKLRAVNDFLSTTDPYRIRDISSKQWDINKNHQDNLLYRIISTAKTVGRELSQSIEEVEEIKKNRKIMDINTVIIQKLLIYFSKHEYTPFDMDEETIDEYLHEKYDQPAKDHGFIQAIDNRFWLQVSDTEEQSRTLLKNFHTKIEHEQTAILELLYLSAGKVPDDTCYTTGYHFYLMTLMISYHWEREAYPAFLTRHLESGDARKITTVLSFTEYSPIAGTDKLLEILYDFFSMEHSPEVRHALIKAMVECDDLNDLAINWWTEEKRNMLGQWMAEESNETIRAEVRKLYRYLKRTHCTS